MIESDMAHSGGPLQGVRVVDCTRGISGIRATGLLADYGADVVWVEPPGGDPYRSQLAVEHAVFNRGKRSVVLDLRDEDGRRSLDDLLATADVVVQSWGPGVAERLGLDYEPVHRLHPEVVYCSITGFGPQSAGHAPPGYEAIVQAVSGAMGQQFGHRPPPIFCAIPFASIGAAFLAVIGIVAALVRREDDGVGRHVETSLYDGALAYMQRWGVTDRELNGEISQPDQYGGFRSVCRAFRCADGEYIGVNTSAVGAFNRLLAVIGFEDRIRPSEDGLDLGAVASPEEVEIMRDEFPAVFARRSRAEWLELLLAADVCAVPELPPGDVFDEPQPRFNGAVITVDDPALGTIEQVGPGATFSLTPPAVPSSAPTPGQHQTEVLAEVQDLRRARHAAGPVAIDGRPLLDGLRILDLSSFYAGPYAARLLADLGADVIKVEHPRGDAMRGRGAPFRDAQAGKRSLAMDLKQPEAEKTRRALIEWADVIEHNMRPGAAEKIGLGYEQVRSLKPEIIYMHSPGWGADGPDKDRQSLAPMLSSYVGAGFECAGQFNPPLFPYANEDSGNGFVGALAMLMALLHRKGTGKGQLIVNPQVNTAMYHMAHVVRRSDGTVLGANTLDPLQYGLESGNRLYETSDGWVCVVATTDEHFARMGEALDLDLAGDDRFATASGRRQHDYELGQVLADAMAQRTTCEVLQRLLPTGIGVAEPATNHNFTFMTDPENERTGRVAVVPHPTHGAIRQFGMHLRVSDAAVAPPRRAPELGEHTLEILTMLDNAPDEIAVLEASDAIVQYQEGALASSL